MIIERIELENIRSYKKEVVKFSENINFLSGDIGSGKSSILQAIEFALFGFKRGDLEGYQLLRNGEDQGSIKLVLRNSKNDKRIEIFRNLKRSKSGDISQNNGHILTEENLIELSPQELNSFVFNLLNFPQDFITKDKNLIYRFTIYTPQEQLKDILFTTPDKRLEIIRKIFNIDKYKQLNDAVSVYLGKVREDKKVYLAKLEPVNKTREEIVLSEETRIKSLELLEEIEKKEKLFIEKREKHLNAIEKRDAKIENLNDKIMNFEKQISKFKEIEKQILSIKEKVKKKQEEISKVDLDNIEHRIKENKIKVIEMEEELKNIKIRKEEIKKDLKPFEKIRERKEKILEQISEYNNLIKNYKEQKSSFDFVLTKCQVKDLEYSVKKDEIRIKKIPSFEEKINILKEKIYKNQISVEKNEKEIKVKLIEVKKIHDIKTCENCRQDVGEEHKSTIKKKLEKEIDFLKKEKESLNDEIKEFRKNLEKNEKEYNSLLELNNEFIKKEEKLVFLKEKEEREKILFDKIKFMEKQILEMKEEKLDEKKKEIELEIEKIEELKKRETKDNEREAKLNKQISEINIEILKYGNIEKERKTNIKEIELYEKEIKLSEKEIENSDKIKLERDNLIKENNIFKEEKKRLNENLIKINENLRLVSKKTSSIETQIKNLEIQIKEKKKELEILEKLTFEYEKVLDDEYLLSKIVVNISTEIERQVFSKYYGEFTYEFEKMFKNLIEDNEIDVRLNSEFTPIIEQNGFETDIKNLSGGEKSSLAIAYRLSLKKIIEDNLEEKQKLSLLILDEPTDGFSDNQISRLGDLLKMSNLKQIILVSHDEKIESISDYIINIEKSNHESKIFSR